MSGRLFLAVVPSVRPAARIYRLAKVVKRARHFLGNLIEPDCLHVTLFFLDEGSNAREYVIRMAGEAARNVCVSPFEVSFDRIASFRGRPGHYPFVMLGGDGLNRLRELRQALGAQLMRNGLKHLVKPDFNPHVTLLYAERQVEEQPIEPLFWRVDAFVLIHSLRGHTHLAQWPLRVE
jgi:RNA 2',3'-cyclic 3'-phosphodiesterase